MEDATLKKYFDDIGEKLDMLTKTIEKIDDRQSKQYKKIIEHDKDIQYIKEKESEEKIETDKKFDIVHDKFRRGEANKKWWFMAIIALSSFVSGIIGFFYTKAP